jgi:hypothetical protein
MALGASSDAGAATESLLSQRALIELLPQPRPRRLADHGRAFLRPDPRGLQLRQTRADNRTSLDASSEGCQTMAKMTGLLVAGRYGSYETWHVRPNGLRDWNNPLKLRVARSWLPRAAESQRLGATCLGWRGRELRGTRQGATMAEPQRPIESLLLRPRTT